MTLPSKKVLSIFIVAAAAVAAVILAFGKNQTSSTINFTHNLLAGDKVEVPKNPNWQAELQKVGVSSLADSHTETLPNDNETTLTDTVSVSLVSNYLALKQSGDLDDASAQNLIDQTIGYIEENKPTTTITRADLNIIADNGKQSIHKYGEDLGLILKTKDLSDLTKESTLFVEVVQSGGISGISELDSSISTYNSMAENLTTMPVPQTFVKAHTDIVNGVSGIATAMNEIKKITTDPFAVLVALQLYQDSLIKIFQATGATSSFISNKGIVYEQGSGGYYLIYGI